MSGKNGNADQASGGGGERDSDRRPSPERELPRKENSGRPSEDPQGLSQKDEDRKEAAADRDPAEGKP